MAQNQNLIEDLLTLGSSMFGNVLDARHELKAQAKQRVESLARHLDLVTREEFDVAFAMVAKARDMQDKLAARLTAIEEKLKLSSAASAIKRPKINLPSVKQAKPKPRRT